VRDKEGYAALQEKLLFGIDKKVELVGHLLERESWDLFAVVFSESHCAGHQFWHLHDESHVRHDPALRRELGDPVKTVYRALDAALGELLGRIDQETLAIVLCSHGMGPHYDASYMLDGILLYLEDPKALERRRLGKEEPLWVRGKRKLSRLISGQAPPSNNRAYRKYFAVPNNDVAPGIRINLVGREPQGKVRPGAEYENVCNKLIEDLLELRNAETREPIVQEVYRTSDRYDGEYLHLLPDLIVEWHREKPISSVWSPKFGAFSNKHRTRRTGDHRSEGLLIGRGPGVGSGKLSPIDSRDIGPTIASYLGVTLTGVDGRAIEELSGSRTAHALHGNATSP
jgi:predicted AlkP superfamily phosphohydrolase/phosphomutase